MKKFLYAKTHLTVKNQFFLRYLKLLIISVLNNCRKNEVINTFTQANIFLFYSIYLLFNTYNKGLFIKKILNIENQKFTKLDGKKYAPTYSYTY